MLIQCGHSLCKQCILENIEKNIDYFCEEHEK